MAPVKWALKAINHIASGLKNRRCDGLVALYDHPPVPAGGVRPHRCLAGELARPKRAPDQVVDQGRGLRWQQPFAACGIGADGELGVGQSDAVPLGRQAQRLHRTLCWTEGTSSSQRNIMNNTSPASVGSMHLNALQRLSPPPLAALPARLQRHRSRCSGWC